MHSAPLLLITQRQLIDLNNIIGSCSWWAACTLMDDNGERFVFGLFFFFSSSQRHDRHSFLHLGTVSLQVSLGFFLTVLCHSPASSSLCFFCSFSLFCFCFFIPRTGAHILHLKENVGAERDAAVPSGRRLKEIKNNGGNTSLCLSHGWSKESSWAHTARF